MKKLMIYQLDFINIVDQFDIVVLLYSLAFPRLIQRQYGAKHANHIVAVFLFGIALSIIL